MKSKLENSKSRQSRDNGTGRVNTAVFGFDAFAAVLHCSFRAIRACFSKVAQLPRTRFRKIGLALNTAAGELADRCLAYAVAQNIAPMPTEGEWLPLPGYGDEDFLDESNGVRRHFIQRFNREQATKMKNRLLAKAAKEGSDFRGLPLYDGHPEDGARLGHVLEIDDAPTRARVRLKLNDLGRKNQQEGYKVYPSPAWLYSRTAAEQTGVILPDELDHIGMTNRPRMTSAKPWTNSEISAASAELQQTTKPKGDHMPKWLITALVAANVLTKPAEGQEPAEDQVQTALNTLIQERAIATNAEKNPLIIAANTAKQTAENALSTAQADAKKFKKLTIDHQLDVAVNEGRLTAAERPAWANKFETDFDATSGELKDKQKALNTKSLNLSPSGKDLSTPAKRSIVYNARVDHYFKQGCKSIDEVIAQMRANEEDAALLDAMTPKTEKASA